MADHSEKMEIPSFPRDHGRNGQLTGK